MGGNRLQMGWRRKRPRRAKTAAVGCDRLPRPQNGKEGVDGSSPSEGLGKVPANRHFDVVYSLNTRTHSGHICGARDASRPFATPSDTTRRQATIASIPENPASKPRPLPERARERPPLSREGVLTPSQRAHAAGREDAMLRSDEAEQRPGSVPSPSNPKAHRT